MAAWFFLVCVCFGWAVLQAELTANPGSLELVKLSSLYFLESLSCPGTHLSQTVLQETGVPGFTFSILDARAE